MHKSALGVLGSGCCLSLWLGSCSVPDREFTPAEEDAGAPGIGDNGSGGTTPDKASTAGASGQASSTGGRAGVGDGNGGNGGSGGSAAVDAAPVPGNSGLVDVPQQSFTEATLSWVKASDDVTPTDMLQYRVYHSLEDNIDSLGDIRANGTPVTEFEAAITTAIVTLEGGKDNYFNIIVRDEADNESAYQMVAVPFSESDSCSKDADCFSGSCRISYRDRDGDNWGDSSTTTGRCDGSIPAGYTGQGGDCCDRGGNDATVANKINPGQKEYQDNEANLCNIKWDYDCSGSVKIKSYDNGCRSSASYPDCENELVQPSTSRCGEQQDFVDCSSTSAGDCQHFPWVDTLGCR